MLLALSVPIVLGTVALAGGEASPITHRAATCGVERWDVKTLSDPKVGDVNFKPHDTSIGRLGKKNPPHVAMHTPRIDGSRRRPTASGLGW